MSNRSEGYPPKQYHKATHWAVLDEYSIHFPPTKTYKTQLFLQFWKDFHVYVYLSTIIAGNVLFEQYACTELMEWAIWGGENIWNSRQFLPGLYSDRPSIPMTVFLITIQSQNVHNYKQSLLIIKITCHI